MSLTSTPIGAAESHPIEQPRPKHRAQAVYHLAEQRAAAYLSELTERVRGGAYASELAEDFHIWKSSHIRPWPARLFRSRRSPDSRDYDRYIRWMESAGKLDDYLARSVSYLYMRDLGRALDSPDTQQRVRRTAAGLKRSLLSGGDPREGMPTDGFDTSSLYRWGKQEGIEDAVIWMIAKLKRVSENIPEGLSAEHAQRKLLKIIAGVVLHTREEMDEDTPKEERSRRLDEAVRLGYSYGLTYPFIDDLLDSNLLSDAEKQRYSDLIRGALLGGTIPKWEDWNEAFESADGRNVDLIRYIHSELGEAFTYIRSRQADGLDSPFFEQAYVFFEAQDIDRNKRLAHIGYTNEQLYIPVILKSSGSRLIARSVGRAEGDEGFERRTFFYGIYNQLADDFADLFDDLAVGAVTPYTYYWKHRAERPDLLNPFEMYWGVIAYLIRDVYGGDANTREVLLDRAVNGLKRARQRLGIPRYEELMEVLASGMPELNAVVRKMVRRAEDVEFFDKLLRDRMLTEMKRDREERETFRELLEKERVRIDESLPVVPDSPVPSAGDSLIDAANYSLAGDGKRLRPILARLTAVEGYGLPYDSVKPLLKSLEYLHTASLIFDDLPSQDNADIRRGRQTLHARYDSATAELSGLLLIQQGVRAQSSLRGFKPETVLALIHYSARKAEELCLGQDLDLKSRGKELTLARLNEICFYKTGVAFEACLVMPAMLANAPQSEIALLEKFAYHAGIAFQIRDDLLDAEGEALLLGKPSGQDAFNGSSTFATVLGMGGAKRAMWDHYCEASDAVKALPESLRFLKHLLDVLVQRER
ncbi:polyprenyl synthetase family protein [Saccharibacillus sp. CPCC 101409]|uniref:polyprenyl synthetase family protein n=1 Tax=Saccharibacillus sp. CPCC 101409 TaxID=3058041 RepID=UPI0026713D9E|nr:polyprenyl synthetase family protein [Saccharibacillus sp. CPCC 101409]MDO3411517.1 polyprenyl synthetase family protein [Saccharibacillus sp. CPCC 101409]